VLGGKREKEEILLWGGLFYNLSFSLVQSKMSQMLSRFMEGRDFETGRYLYQESE
jgi:hypothetical protein